MFKKPHRFPFSPGQRPSTSRSTAERAPALLRPPTTTRRPETTHALHPAGRRNSPAPTLTCQATHTVVPVLRSRPYIHFVTPPGGATLPKTKLSHLLFFDNPPTNDPPDGGTHPRPKPHLTRPQTFKNVFRPDLQPGQLEPFSKILVRHFKIWVFDSKVCTFNFFLILAPIFSTNYFTYTSCINTAPIGGFAYFFSMVLTHSFD